MKRRAKKGLETLVLIAVISVKNEYRKGSQVTKYSVLIVVTFGYILMERILLLPDRVRTADAHTSGNTF